MKNNKAQKLEELLLDIGFTKIPYRTGEEEVCLDYKGFIYVLLFVRERGAI